MKPFPKVAINPRSSLFITGWQRLVTDKTQNPKPSLQWWGTQQTASLLQHQYFMTDTVKGAPVGTTNGRTLRQRRLWITSTTNLRLVGFYLPSIYTSTKKNCQTCINCLQLQSNQFSDLHKLPHHAVEVDLDQLLPQYYQNNLLHDSPRKHCYSKQGN